MINVYSRQDNDCFELHRLDISVTDAFEMVKDRERLDSAKLVDLTDVLLDCDDNRRVYYVYDSADLDTASIIYEIWES